MDLAVKKGGIDTNNTHDHSVYVIVGRKNK